MLSYQHIYHAGNFADAHKHALLAATLSALTARHARICILDTHAGRGLYDLTSPEAQKKQEYANGISGIWDRDDSAIAPLAPWLTLVRACNQGHTDEGLRFYPGSPSIEAGFLRPADRLVLAELHPGEFSELEKNLKPRRNVELKKQNGFDLLSEILPPPERNGIAVINPPYEIKTDYAELPRRVEMAWKKWPVGTFFIWYPILTAAPHLEMLTALRNSSVKNVLVSELCMKDMPDEGYAMQGSGVAIVNPPVPRNAVDTVAQAVAHALPAEAEAGTSWLSNRAVDPATGLIAV